MGPEDDEVVALLRFVADLGPWFAMTNEHLSVRNEAADPGSYLLKPFACGSADLAGRFAGIMVERMEERDPSPEASGNAGAQRDGLLRRGAEVGGHQEPA